jgi:hypothetical protein
LRAHRLFERRRERRRQYPLADARAGGGKLGDVIDIEAGKFGADALIEAALLEELAVGMRGGREAGRDLHP